MKKKKTNFQPETNLCHDQEEYYKHNGAIVPPIFQNSLFAFESWEKLDEAFAEPTEHFIYSRLNNPTAGITEEKIASLCHGEKAKLYGSGMGAIAAAIFHFVNAGDHIITIDSLYAPAKNFISGFLANKCGISHTSVSGLNVKDFEEAIRPNTRLIYLESPSSITFQMQDLKVIAQLAERHDIATVVDNTWASPIFQRPLDLGIDMEVHSVSKYLCGHSDVVAGVVVGSKVDLDKMLLSEHALLGAKMAPIEAWLILRSLRTLPIRMKQHEASAIQVAEFLEHHPMITKVYYPGLPSHPQYELGKKQMSGYGGLLSFELDSSDIDQIKRFVNNLNLFKLGVSWGGHESLVYAPLISYSRELTPEQFASTGIQPGLIRISIGLESADDLIHDLHSALSILK